MSTFAKIACALASGIKPTGCWRTHTDITRPALFFATHTSSRCCPSRPHARPGAPCVWTARQHTRTTWGWAAPTPPPLTPPLRSVRARAQPANARRQAAPLHAAAAAPPAHTAPGSRQQLQHLSHPGAVQSRLRGRGLCAASFPAAWPAPTQARMFHCMPARRQHRPTQRRALERLQRRSHPAVHAGAARAQPVCSADTCPRRAAHGGRCR